MTDPYSEILEIPKRFRPPTYYQILAIAPSEMDREKIKVAAERQLLRVAHYNSAANVAACQSLADDIVRARDTLLDPIARQQYDLISPDAAEPWWKPEGEVHASPDNSEVNETWWKEQIVEAGEPTRQKVLATSESMHTSEQAPPPPPIEYQRGKLPEKQSPIPSRGVEALPAQPATAWWQENIPVEEPASARLPSVEIPAIIPVAPLPASQSGVPTTSVEAAAPAPAVPFSAPQSLAFEQPSAIAPPAHLAPPPQDLISGESELFAARRYSPKSNGGGKIILIGIALLVVGGAAGGVFYILNKSDESSKQVSKGPQSDEKQSRASEGNSKNPVIKSDTDRKVRDPNPKTTDSRPKKLDPEPKKIEPEPKKIDPEPKKTEAKKVEPEPKIAQPVFTDPVAFKNHEGMVLGISLRRDSKSFVSISDDRKVFVTSIADGRKSELHKMRSEGLTAVLCDSDNTAVFCDGYTVVVYDLRKNQVVGTFSNPRGKIECLAAAADGSFVLTGGNDGCIRMWKATEENAAYTFDLDEKETVTCIALNSNAMRLVVGMSDGRIEIWDVPKRAQLKRFQAHKDRITCLALTMDGARLASGGVDGRARIWETSSGKPLNYLEGHRGPLLAIGWDSKCQHVVTAGADKKTYLWNVQSGKRLEWAAKIEAKVFCLAIDAQDRFVLAGEGGGVIQLLPLPPLRINGD